MSGTQIVVNPVPGDAKSKELKAFAFDSIYGTNSTQDAVFQDLVIPLVKNALAGDPSTVFAFGQTGSGKTFTMQVQALSTTTSFVS